MKGAKKKCIYSFIFHIRFFNTFCALFACRSKLMEFFVADLEFLREMVASYVRKNILARNIYNAGWNVQRLGCACGGAPASFFTSI